MIALGVPGAAPVAMAAKNAGAAVIASPRLLWKLLPPQSLRELLVEILGHNHMPFDVKMPWVVPLVVARYFNILRVVIAENVIQIPYHDPY